MVESEMEDSMPRGMKKTAKAEKTLRKSSAEVDFRNHPETVGTGSLAIFLSGINRPKTLIGKISKVMERGIEVYAEAYYNIEWKNVIRVYEPREARFVYDTAAAIDELAEVDADVKQAKLDMKFRKEEEVEDFVLAKPEPMVQEDDETEEVEEEIQPVIAKKTVEVKMRKTRSKSITIMDKTFDSKNDAYRWLRSEKKMSWKEIISICK